MNRVTKATDEAPLLSIIIPAYNEASRLPPYLDAIQCYLETSRRERCEIIVVDDGSQDETGAIVERRASDWPGLSVCRHDRNRGKGAALRTGALAARGEMVLFVDADGATAIAEERKLGDAIAQGADVAVGSRLIDSHSVSVRRSWHRRLMGRAFARATRAILPLAIRDTQCGFKMFRRDVCVMLIKRCREQGYLLDVELLAWAEAMRFRVAEIPVSWRDVPGSKLCLARDAGEMLKGLWRVRRAVRGMTEAEASRRELSTEAMAADSLSV